MVCFAFYMGVAGCLLHTLPETRGRGTGISLSQRVHAVLVTLQSCRLAFSFCSPGWEALKLSSDQQGWAFHSFPLPDLLFPKTLIQPVWLCPHRCQLTDAGRHEACIFFLGKAVQEGKFSLTEGALAGALDASSVLPQLKVGRAGWWGCGVGGWSLGNFNTSRPLLFCSPLLWELLVQPGLNKDRSPGSSRGWCGDQRRWQDSQGPGHFRGLSPPHPRRTHWVGSCHWAQTRALWSILSS